MFIYFKKVPRSVGPDPARIIRRCLDVFHVLVCRLLPLFAAPDGVGLLGRGLWCAACCSAPLGPWVHYDMIRLSIVCLDFTMRYIYGTAEKNEGVRAHTTEG